MILLRRLKLENFLSHKDTVLSFGDSEKLLIDGNSGSGKSAIVEAIVWCLYGKARVDNRYLIRRGAKSTKVTLTLAADDGFVGYQITRTATTTGGHTIEVLTADGADTRYTHIDRNGVRDIQDWIENELLHASYLLFVNSIAYVQDNSDTFVKQTAAKRKELLLEIVHANEYAELHKKTSERLTSEVGEETKIVSRIAMLNESSARLSTIVTDIEKHLDLEKKLQFDLLDVRQRIEHYKKLNVEFEQLKQKIESAKALLKVLDATIQTKKKSIDEKKTQIQRATNLEKEISELALKIEAIGDVQPKLDQLSDKMAREQNRTLQLSFVRSNRAKPIDYAAQIVEIDKQLKPLTADSMTCPSGDKCPLSVPILGQISFLREEKEKRQEYAMEQEKMRQKADSAELALSVPLATQDELDLYTVYSDQVRAKELLETDLDIKKAVLSDVDVSALDIEITILLEEMSNAIEDQASAEGVVKSLGARPDLTSLNTTSLSILQSSELILEADIRAIQREITTAQNASIELLGISEQLKTLGKELVVAKENIGALEATKEAFSQKGIPALVVDMMVPQLEERINAILGQLSDFRMRIDTQRKSANGEGIVEGLYLTIFNESGEEFDFSSYSGGQKLKITVAISEALASLQKCGFRIMDETFTALDEESTDEFVEVMEKLQAQFKQILCITHLRNVKDLFDKKVTVTRINSLSVVEQ